MKTLILTIAMVVSASNAQASFFQNECGNASGSIRMSSGHVKNEIVLKTVKYDDKNQRKEDTVVLSRQDVDVIELKKTEISSDSQKHCEAGSEAGWGSWRSIDVVEVKLARRDGKSLPAGSTDLQKDGTIVANLICDDQGNSQILCEKK